MAAHLRPSGHLHLHVHATPLHESSGRGEIAQAAPAGRGGGPSRPAAPPASGQPPAGGSAGRAPGRGGTRPRPPTHSRAVRRSTPCTPRFPDFIPEGGSGVSKRWMMLCAAVAGLALAGCRVEQTEEAQPPEVQVEPGQLPEYETEPGQVEVRPDTERVVVPDVDVERPEQQQTR